MTTPSAKPRPWKSPPDTPPPLRPRPLPQAPGVAQEESAVSGSPRKVKVLVSQPCLTLSDPMDCSPPGSSVHGMLQARILEWEVIPFSKGSSRPGIGTTCISRWVLYQHHHLGSPCLTSEKVKVAHLCPALCDPMDCPWNSPGQNTGVGNLSLFQGIFPTQGSNPGLLHCRQILYQLSHKTWRLRSPATGLEQVTTSLYLNFPICTHLSTRMKKWSSHPHCRSFPERSGFC